MGCNVLVVVSHVVTFSCLLGGLQSTANFEMFTIVEIGKQEKEDDCLEDQEVESEPKKVRFQSCLTFLLFNVG